MRLLGNVPSVLILFPIGLLICDVSFKVLKLGKRLPVDTMADMSLAALTFNGVHLLTHNLVGTGVIVLIVVNCVAWFYSLEVAHRLEKRFEKVGQHQDADFENRTRAWLGLSYFGGASWFLYSTSRMLNLVP